MTQGFYQQLDVDPAAAVSEIRAAYTKTVANIVRQRRTLTEQGGDPETLDLRRASVDEAWSVLSDSSRRKRYNAMCSLKHGEPIDEMTLWETVAGALVPPAAATAVDLLRETTSLQMGRLPSPKGPVARTTPSRLTAPKAAPTVAAFPSVDEAPTTPTMVPQTDIGQPPQAAPPPIIQLPTPTRRPPSALRVVEGADSPPVIVLPTARAQSIITPTISVSLADLTQLVEQHGPSGTLLTAAREANGMTLEEVAEATRISARYLSALENEDFDALPSTTFVRGYVRAFAKHLGLDETAISEGYMSRFS